jgi:hypothetical protein
MTGAGLGAAIAVALTFIPAHAEISTPYASVEVAPARLELPVPNNQPIKRTFTVTNLSTSPETVEILSTDFTVSADGSYVWLPANSTPWSIAPGLSITSAERALDIAPRSSIQVQLTYFPITTTALRAGAVLFEPKLIGPAAAPAGTGIVIKQQAIVPVLAIPAGSDGKLDSRVTLAGEPVSLSLSGVLNVGPLSFAEPGALHVSATFKNTGNALFRFDPWVTWSNLGRDFWRQELAPAIAMPGQRATVNGSTTANLPGQGITDLAPIFGIVRVRVTATPILLGEAGPTAAQERWVVIAPWRILGVLCAVLGGIYWGARRARREQIRRRMVREYLAERDES